MFPQRLLPHRSLRAQYVSRDAHAQDPPAGRDSRRDGISAAMAVHAQPISPLPISGVIYVLGRIANQRALLQPDQPVLPSRPTSDAVAEKRHHRLDHRARTRLGLRAVYGTRPTRV